MLKAKTQPHPQTWSSRFSAFEDWDPWWITDRGQQRFWYGFVGTTEFADASGYGKNNGITINNISSVNWVPDAKLRCIKLENNNQIPDIDNKSRIALDRPRRSYSCLHLYRSHPSFLDHGTYRELAQAWDATDQAIEEVVDALEKSTEAFTYGKYRWQRIGGDVGVPLRGEDAELTKKLWLKWVFCGVWPWS